MNVKRRWGVHAVGVTVYCVVNICACVCVCVRVCVCVCKCVYCQCLCVCVCVCVVNACACCERDCASASVCVCAHTLPQYWTTQDFRTETCCYISHFVYNNITVSQKRPRVTDASTSSQSSNSESEASTSSSNYTVTTECTSIQSLVRAFFLLHTDSLSVFSSTRYTHNMCMTARPS
jgi:hypothetical protein